MKPIDAFNEIQNRLGDFIKSSPAKDLEKNMKSVMQQGFSRLDLVTREEFDIQTQVLARTRARLESLEKRVTELENTLAHRQDTPR